MRIVVAGASGFLGQAFREHAARRGHDVVRLVRGEPVSANESRWDPDAGTLDPDVIEDADVVVNVAGSSFVRWPFTEAYKREFTASRVETTRVLAEAIAKSEKKPALLAQNGTSIYGDRGDEVLTEDSPVGDDGSFLNAVTHPWQAATGAAEAAGARVCHLRTSFVLDRKGGSFRPLLWMFRAGLGGPAASGRQYFSTITLNDWVRAVGFLAENDCEGPYNLSGPGPTTNEEFVRALGRHVHRPTLLRIPGAPLRTVFPELAPELLSSFRVEPKRLLEAGFEFEQPTLEDRLTWALTH